MEIWLSQPAISCIFTGPTKPNVILSWHALGGSSGPALLSHYVLFVLVKN